MACLDVYKRQRHNGHINTMNLLLLGKKNVPLFRLVTSFMSKFTLFSNVFSQKRLTIHVKCVGNNNVPKF